MQERAPITRLSATLAAVAWTEWISLLPASTPTWEEKEQTQIPFGNDNQSAEVAFLHPLTTLL
jgi:hypothetical protein